MALLSSLGFYPRRLVIVGTAVGLCFAWPAAGWAQDLGDAFDYAQKHFDRGVARDYEPQVRQRSRHEAVGMLSSRDVEPGKPLSDYDCLDSAIDAMPVMRFSSKEKAALRQCLVHRFERDQLPGYRTLGAVRLDAVAVGPLIEAAAAEYEVPAIVLDGIVMLLSGYRPHAISTEGHIGLMQLRADLLAAEDVSHGDLMDPRESIRAGAAYLRALIFRHGGLRGALLAYRDPTDLTYRSRMKRWFVDTIIGFYHTVNRKFPYKLGAENMSFVWTWLE